MTDNTIADAVEDSLRDGVKALADRHGLNIAALLIKTAARGLGALNSVVMAEIQEPELRGEVMRMIMAAIGAGISANDNKQRTTE